ADAGERKPGESVEEIFTVAWWLFDLIIKSMQLKLHDAAAPPLAASSATATGAAAASMTAVVCNDIEVFEPGLHRLIKRFLVALVRALKISLSETHRKATTPYFDPNAKDADKSQA